MQGAGPEAEGWVTGSSCDGSRPAREGAGRDREKDIELRASGELGSLHCVRRSLAFADARGIWRSSVSGICPLT